MVLTLIFACLPIYLNYFSIPKSIFAPNFILCFNLEQFFTLKFRPMNKCTKRIILDVHWQKGTWKGASCIFSVIFSPDWKKERHPCKFLTGEAQRRKCNYEWASAVPKIIYCATWAESLIYLSDFNQIWYKPILFNEVVDVFIFFQNSEI